MKWRKNYSFHFFISFVFSFSFLFRRLFFFLLFFLLGLIALAPTSLFLWAEPLWPSFPFIFLLLFTSFLSSSFTFLNFTRNFTQLEASSPSAPIERGRSGRKLLCHPAMGELDTDQWFHGASIDGVLAGRVRRIWLDVLQGQLAASIVAGGEGFWGFSNRGGLGRTMNYGLAEVK